MIQTLTIATTGSMTARRLMRPHLIVLVHLSHGSCAGVQPALEGIDTLSRISVTIYKELKAKGAIDATGGASAGVGVEYEW